MTKWAIMDECILKKYILKQKYFSLNSSYLVLTRGERLPEEVAAACFALPLREGKVPPHHLLPDSHLLLLQHGQHLVHSRCHQFRHKLQQEQASKILKKDRKGKEWQLKTASEVTWKFERGFSFINLHTTTYISDLPCRLRGLLSVFLSACPCVEHRWRAPAAQRKTKPPEVPAPESKASPAQTENKRPVRERERVEEGAGAERYHCLSRTCGADK